MKRNPKSLLWDARDAARAISAMTAGKKFDDFRGDIVLRSAGERQFEIAGEALRQLARLDPALAAEIPDLHDIVAFRNILIHGYAVTDHARVWQVVQEDCQVPALFWIACSRNSNRGSGDSDAHAALLTCSRAKPAVEA